MSNCAGKEAVLVTGGGGFIGSHLVRRLVAEGCCVHIVVRPGSRLWRLAGLASTLTVWTGEITDFRFLLHCIETSKPRVIYHLAASTDVRKARADLDEVARSVEVNLVGTLTVLRAAALATARPEIVIRTGGLEEYGNGPNPSREDQRELPVSSYSASQVAAAHYSQMLQPRLPLAVATLRLALVYGPGQSFDFLVPSLIVSCLRGHDFNMPDGRQGRDVVFVADVVDGLERAAKAPALAGEIINLASGTEHTVQEIATAIVELTGTGSRLRYMNSSARTAGAQRMCGATEKATALLGWQARTPLREGLAHTIDWYREQTALVPPAVREHLEGLQANQGGG